MNFATRASSWYTRSPKTVPGAINGTATVDVDPAERGRPSDAATWALVYVAEAVTSGPGRLWNVSEVCSPHGSWMLPFSLICACQGGATSQFNFCCGLS